MKPVNLSQIADELGTIPEEYTLYINKKTGETRLISPEDEDIIEGEEDELDLDDLPAWQVENIPKVREVLESEDWVALPGKFEIHEWQIMRDFAASVESPEVQSEIVNAIHGSGAFRYFKDVVHRRGLTDDWYRFRDGAIEEIVKAALDEHGIPYE